MSETKSTAYTLRDLRREARSAAVFSQREAARIARTGFRAPLAVTFGIEVFTKGTVRLNVEYLVKDDDHPHATSTLL